MTPTDPCRAIELRQYTLHPGRRDELIALFEREFIESQQALGLQVLGVFRDAGDEDRFVWWRGFADMAARAVGLQAFYSGPVWQAHRNAANATMIDSDNVLLLRPLTPWPRAGEQAAPWQVLVCPLAAPPDDALIDALRRSGGCWLATEPAPNNFPRLPVREGEQVVVGLACGTLAVAPELQAAMSAPPQVLNLIPTTRSALF
jgi:quinol monooxygenase YgiN